MTDLNLQRTTVTTQLLTFREKEAVKKKNNYTCTYCGCTNKLMLTVEHKDAKARGGSNDAKNLTCSCVVCNQLKGALSHSEFKHYYKTLQTLYDLKKVNIVLNEIGVKFNHNAYPGL